MKDSKTIRKYFIVTLMGFVFISAQSQFFKKEFSSRDVVINKQDTIIYCSVLIHKSNKAIKEDRTYYWYMNGKTGENTGGYAGYLLHGEYKVFTGENKMVEKGWYEYGLKDGKWIKWYSKGNIKEIIEYKDGLKHGTYCKFGQDGIATDTIYYKNGEIKKPFHLRLKLPVFLKKEKKSDSTFQENEPVNPSEPIPEKKTKKIKNNKDMMEKSDQ